VNGLERRAIAKACPGLISLSVHDGPDNRDEYDDDEAPCCMSGAMHGPRACTCWQPVYDREQAEPKLKLQPASRTKCCADCAYLNGSPEKLAGRGEELDDIAGDGSRFSCHQGMRRVLVYRHPNGREIAADPAEYQPPIVGLVPFKADGTPADLCAGWAARRKALLG
jgi:hypothetical protein